MLVVVVQAQVTMSEKTHSDAPIRVGIVGLGYIGTTVGGEFAHHPQARVAAVCDLAESARVDAGEQFSVPPESRYEQYEEMLEGENLDAVLIGTPHTLHYDQVVAALERGLHVLCDKPLTTDLEQAQDLYERTQNADEVLMVGYQRHLNPAFVEARQRWTDTDRTPQWITAEISQDWVERFSGTWRSDPDLSGGGYLYDTGSHILDAILWTTDLTPTAVRADMTFVDDEQRVDERAELWIEFEEGANASVSVYGKTPCTREHIHIWDDEGAVYLDGREWEDRQLSEIDADSTTHTPYLGGQSHPNKAESFVRAIREGTAPPATPMDGLRVTAVTEAAYESARGDGDWVSVNL